MRSLAHVSSVIAWACSCDRRVTIKEVQGIRTKGEGSVGVVPGWGGLAPDEGLMVR